MVGDAGGRCSHWNGSVGLCALSYSSEPHLWSCLESGILVPLEAYLVLVAFLGSLLLIGAGSGSQVLLHPDASTF